MSDTLSWFRANQSLLFLLNAACLAEKQQIIQILYFLNWLETTVYHTLGEHVIHSASNKIWCEGNKNYEMLSLINWKGKKASQSSVFLQKYWPKYQVINYLTYYPTVYFRHYDADAVLIAVGITAVCTGYFLF